MYPRTDIVIDDIEVEWEGRRLTMSGEEATHAIAGWDAPGRLQRLNQRYGPWGLAFLESIVRLADIECSEQGT
jgi:hypothetical protein